MRYQSRCCRVGKGINLPACFCDFGSLHLVRVLHSGRRDQQTMNPDCPLMRIATTGCSEHCSLCIASNECKLFSERLAGMSSFGVGGHLAKVWFDSNRRTLHDRKREITMGSGAASIDKAWFRR